MGEISEGIKFGRDHCYVSSRNGSFSEHDIKTKYKNLIEIMKTTLYFLGFKADHLLIYIKLNRTKRKCISNVML